MDELLAQTLDAFENKNLKKSGVHDEILVEEFMKKLEEEAEGTHYD